MKRLRLWLRELNLSQQLTTIIFIAISGLTIFIFAFLSPEINAFTTSEMYRMLHISQESLVFYLNSEPEISPQAFENSTSGVIHEIYDPEKDVFIPLGSDSFSAQAEESIRNNVRPFNRDVRDYQMANPDDKNSQILYSVVRLNDGRYLASVMLAASESQFRGLLVNNIVNVNLLVAIMLFILLTLWVTSIIYPLNQIKTYITKIKNDEPAVLAINRHDEIGEVADALRDMEFELSKQNREKQEMIQNISHDLKTPIATIRSYGESIKDGIYPYGTLEQSVDVIIEHADRLEKKVRSLIALNKMGYLLDDCPEGDTLNMNEVIDKVLLSLKVIRPEITFERNLDKNVLFHGDEDPWRIVVENLIDNALRYAETSIHIDLHPGELAISNDGKQISEDRLGKLFKPYEKGTDGQFGLGLSIVYKVVSTYGYHIVAENLPHGVCFRIWKELPKQELKAIQKEKKKEEVKARTEQNVKQNSRRKKKKRQQTGA